MFGVLTSGIRRLRIDELMATHAYQQDGDKKERDCADVLHDAASQHAAL
jgi:hypothetical protein